MQKFSCLALVSIAEILYGPGQGQDRIPKLGIKHKARLGPDLAIQDPIGL